MKRSNVPRLGDEPAPMSQQQPVPMQQQPGVSNMHTLAQTAQPQMLGAAAMLSVGGGRSRPAGVLNYMKPVTYAPKHPQPPQQQQQTLQITPRHKPMGSQSPVSGPVPAAQFQRLKVEDALSYLDQVKYKFNTQPQVYNDFLDIMKEFKSQTIDTPGVITRVSNLFKGHPELIVGFNTFLPPGYKIEVQSNGQVSVSMPSPTALGASGVLVGVHHPPQPQLVHLLPVPQSVSTAIVHNLSVNASPANTLHHISQAHQQIEAAAIHHPQNAMPSGGSTHVPAAPPGQPVEFNHAIEYVNKIKSRFSRQPDKYKRFLEILHAYQRGHRDMKQPQSKQQTEQEVYSQVAKLFENQEDLLAEFGQFLPDAKTVVPPAPAPPQRESEPERYSVPAASPPSHLQQIPKLPTPMALNVSAQPPLHHQLKRSPSFSSNTQIGMSAPPLKKSRGPCPLTGAVGGTCATGAVPIGGVPIGGTVAPLRDVSYAEAAKYGTMQEYNFFDRVRKALKNHHVYDNFLRCLLLYTHEVISSSELVTVTSGFLSRYPELRRWLQHFVSPDLHHDSHGYKSRSCSVSEYEPLGAMAAHLRHDRPQGDAAMDIDLSTCKRLGTSYCALPRGSAEAASRKCSGRTALCKEVLNDTWVSFPTWSEDSTFVTSRKTQYEEYIYRCEDERFELDVVIETNAATIRVLEGVQKKLSRLSPEEASKYRLDETLGGHSQTIHQRALRRIYGDKVAVDIIAGLKKNPVVAVPVVLRRLKAKEEEWREAQKGFNKQWREQNEKYYLKSLDHQGINFKQNDLKAMRSKSLFNEVESAYAARKPPPHVTVDYNMTSRQEAIKIVRDAADLLIHHARRQTGIQKAEKRRIKHLLRVFLPDLLNHPRQPLSDDERDSEDKEESPSPDSPCAGGSPSADVKKEREGREGVKEEKDEKESSESDTGSDPRLKDKENTPKNHNQNTGKAEPAPLPNNVKRPSSAGQDDKTDIKKETHNSDDDYRDYSTTGRWMVCTSSWYLFLRLHGALCGRLGGAYRAANPPTSLSHALPRRPSVAHALRLKPNNLPADVNSPADYYNALLELVKGVLDGNMESSAYEDAAREMLGIKAYPAYTLDKLVSYAVRQLQHCVSEPWSVRCAELAGEWGAGRRPASYLHTATNYLQHHHTAFKVTFFSGEQCRVTFELLEGSGDGRTSPQLNQDPNRMSPTLQSSCNAPNSVVGRVASWSTYCERYVRPDLTSGPLNKPVFLRRNIRRTNGPPNVTNLASSGVCPESSTQHARRKPHKIHDFNECTIANRLRLVAARPYNVYRKGCLTSARTTHMKLHATRRARLRAWLQSKQT